MVFYSVWSTGIVSVLFLAFCLIRSAFFTNKTGLLDGVDSWMTRCLIRASSLSPDNVDGTFFFVGFFANVPDVVLMRSLLHVACYLHWRIVLKQGGVVIAPVSRRSLRVGR